MEQKIGEVVLMSMCEACAEHMRDGGYYHVNFLRGYIYGDSYCSAPEMTSSAGNAHMPCTRLNVYGKWGGSHTAMCGSLFLCCLSIQWIVDNLHKKGVNN